MKTQVSVVLFIATCLFVVLHLTTCRVTHLSGDTIYEKDDVFNPSMDNSHIAVRRAYTALAFVSAVEKHFDMKPSEGSLVDLTPYSTAYYYSTIDVYNSKGLQVIKGKEDWSVEDPRMILVDGDYLICLTAFDGQKKFHPVYYYRKEMHEYIMEDGMPAQSGNKNWCPFLDEQGRVCIHTDASPVWKVYTLDVPTGRMTPLVATKLETGETKLRCSTTWRSFSEKEYLVGLHVAKRGQYYSVLALVNKKTLLPVVVGRSFCNGTHERIQFLSGLDVDDEYVYLGYGIADKKAVIQRVRRDDVVAYLTTG